MPVSESYFLQCLLDRTNAEPAEIDWRHAGPASYWATVAGIRVWLRVASEVTGSRVVLDLSDCSSEVTIFEPQAGGLFRRKYGSAEENRTAELFRCLLAGAARQVARRRSAALESENAVRERMFRRVLFGE